LSWSKLLFGSLKTLALIEERGRRAALLMGERGRRAAFTGVLPLTHLWIRIWLSGWAFFEDSALAGWMHQNTTDLLNFL